MYSASPVDRAVHFCVREAQDILQGITHTGIELPQEVADHVIGAAPGNVQHLAHVRSIFEQAALCLLLYFL